jgi:hypothetical protein
MADIFSRRFAELIEQCKTVAATAHTETISGLPPSQQLNAAKLLGWTTKATSLLQQACGADSVHIAQFNLVGTGAGAWTSSVTRGEFYLEVSRAAQEDYDVGYLVSVRSMVSAEVFSSELEQAEELLRSGYCVAAAVIAGTVLETTLRSLCATNGQTVSNLDRMNDELAKAGVYNALEKKSVTAMAGIRNAAAHGQTSDFTIAQVEGMLRDITRFVTEHALRSGSGGLVRQRRRCTPAIATLTSTQR